MKEEVTAGWAKLHNAIHIESFRLNELSDTERTYSTQILVGKPHSLGRLGVNV
jgi:hypothetical protein